MDFPGGFFYRDPYKNYRGSVSTESLGEISGGSLGEISEKKYWQILWIQPKKFFYQNFRKCMHSSLMDFLKKNIKLGKISE